MGTNFFLMFAKMLKIFCLGIHSVVPEVNPLCGCQHIYCEGIKGQRLKVRGQRDEQCCKERSAQACRYTPRA